MVKRSDLRAARIARAKKYHGWLRCSQGDGLVWEKEVIPEGEWAKLNRDGKGIKFETYRSTLHHWAKSVGDLRASGIIPVLAKSHDGWDQSEEKLGEIIGARVGKNKRGRDALFARVRFEDEKTKAIALKGDVSIGSPDVWYDGRGKKWVYPFQHLASTNSPVIPGLEKWQAIAASFNLAKGSTMDLEMLIELLGLTDAAATAESEEEKLGLVKAKLMELMGGGAPPTEPEEPAVEAANTGTSAGTVTSAGTGGTNVGKGAARKVSATVSFSKDNPPPPVLVTTVGDGRRATIDGMVAQGKFSAAVGAKIAAAFCSDDSIMASLCSNEPDVEFKRALDFAETSAANPPLKPHGRVPVAADFDDGTSIELSHNNGKVIGPLDVMKKRAEAAKA